MTGSNRTNGSRVVAQPDSSDGLLQSLVGQIDDCAALICALYLEGTLHENFVEREGQAIDGQSCGSARPAAVHYERKRNVGAYAQPCDRGCTGDSCFVPANSRSRDLAGHIHGVNSELRAPGPCTVLRSTSKAFKCALSVAREMSGGIST